MTWEPGVLINVAGAAILVIAVGVGLLIWHAQLLDRRRTPEERYQRAARDVRRAVEVGGVSLGGWAAGYDLGTGDDSEYSGDGGSADGA